jgi:hypothetical protein
VGVGLVLLIAIAGVLLIFGLTLLPNGGINDSSLANLVAIKTNCTICQTLPGEKGEKVKIFLFTKVDKVYVLTSLHLLKRERPEPGKRATKETRATREIREILAQTARCRVQMECASPIHFSRVPRVKLAQMVLLELQDPWELVCRVCREYKVSRGRAVSTERRVYKARLAHLETRPLARQALQETALETRRSIMFW